MYKGRMGWSTWGVGGTRGGGGGVVGHGDRISKSDYFFKWQSKAV